MRRRHEERVAAELPERAHRVDRALGRPPLALEHEAAHRGVDRSEMAVEELLRVVRLGGDVRALAELEHGLEGRRRVAAGAGDDEAIVLGGAERLAVELAEDVGGEPGDVLALQRATGRDRAGVAHRVAVALLDRRRRDDDVVDRLRDRALGGAGDQPRLPGEAADRLVREARPALVRDRDEHVGLVARPRARSRAPAPRARMRARRGTTCRSP